MEDRHPARRKWRLGPFRRAQGPCSWRIPRLRYLGVAHRPGLCVLRTRIRCVQMHERRRISLFGGRIALGYAPLRNRRPPGVVVTLHMSSHMLLHMLSASSHSQDAQESWHVSGRLLRIHRGLIHSATCSTEGITLQSASSFGSSSASGARPAIGLEGPFFCSV